jgi:uncharacterized protein YdhG (YjbR/CyaY superfamily)
MRAVGSSSGDRSKAFPAIERKHGHPMTHWFALLEQSDATRYEEQMALLQQHHGFGRAHANAVVMTHRGSSTTRRYETPEEYFGSLAAEAAVTARAIFAAIRKGVPGLELVVAWNQPMLKHPSGYVFGLSASRNHLTLAPFSAAVIDAFADRLGGFRRGKKTFGVPLDWTVDAGLLVAMTRARLAELGAATR